MNEQIFQINSTLERIVEHITIKDLTKEGQGLDFLAVEDIIVSLKDSAEFARNHPDFWNLYPPRHIAQLDSNLNSFLNEYDRVRQFSVKDGYSKTDQEHIIASISQRYESLDDFVWKVRIAKANNQQTDHIISKLEDELQKAEKSRIEFEDAARETRHFLVKVGYLTMLIYLESKQINIKL